MALELQHDFEASGCRVTVHTGEARAHIVVKAAVQWSDAPTLLWDEEASCSFDWRAPRLPSGAHSKDRKRRCIMSTFGRDRDMWSLSLDWSQAQPGRHSAQGKSCPRAISAVIELPDSRTVTPEGLRCFRIEMQAEHGYALHQTPRTAAGNLIMTSGQDMQEARECLHRQRGGFSRAEAKRSSLHAQLEGLQSWLFQQPSAELVRLLRTRLEAEEVLRAKCQADLAASCNQTWTCCLVDGEEPSVSTPSLMDARFFKPVHQRGFEFDCVLPATSAAVWEEMRVPLSAAWRQAFCAVVFSTPVAGWRPRLHNHRWKRHFTSVPI